MITLKFTKNLNKLIGQGTTSKLIAVFPFTADQDIHSEYMKSEKISADDGFSTGGEFVLLVLLGQKGIYTSLRKRNDGEVDNYEYYNSHIGEDVKIKIVGTEEKEDGQNEKF